MDIWDAQSGLRRTIALRSICVIGRQKGARHTIELRSILIIGRQTIEPISMWIVGLPKGAAPDDKAQIHMDYGTPKGVCARRNKAQIRLYNGMPEGHCARR